VHTALNSRNTAQVSLACSPVINTQLIIYTGSQQTCSKSW